jgi:hypothetical protein
MSALEFEDALFDSIATLIHEQRQATRKDRRDIERHAYRCVQLVAPFDGQQLPEQREFQQVMCHDLSPQGFSFLVGDRPVTRQVIVALGQVPFKFLVAEVVRVAPGEREDGAMYKVGCRFVRRIAGS